MQSLRNLLRLLAHSVKMFLWMESVSISYTCINSTGCHHFILCEWDRHEKSISVFVYKLQVNTKFKFLFSSFINCFQVFPVVAWDLSIHCLCSKASISQVPWELVFLSLWSFTSFAASSRSFLITVFHDPLLSSYIQQFTKHLLDLFFHILPNTAIICSFSPSVCENVSATMELSI